MDFGPGVTWDMGCAFAGEPETSRRVLPSRTSSLEMECCRDPVSPSLGGEDGMRGEDGGV